jgi:hypothetical protein
MRISKPYISQGVFHVELKYTTRGPRLIEVNCRMGGGPVRLTNLLVWGVDLVEEHLLTTAGIPSRPPVSVDSAWAQLGLSCRASGRTSPSDHATCVPDALSEQDSCEHVDTGSCGPALRLCLKSLDTCQTLHLLGEGAELCSQVVVDLGFMGSCACTNAQALSLASIA